MSMDFVAFLNGAAAAPDVDAEWAQTMRDAAAEIERLQDELKQWKKEEGRLAAELKSIGDIAAKQEVQLAVMRAALESMIKEFADESPEDDWSCVRTARQALASDAGKAAADVLAAVDAVRKLPFQHTGSIGALFDAYDAHRAEKEGLELVKTPDGPAYLRPGGEASEGRGDG